MNKIFASARSSVAAIVPGTDTFQVVGLKGNKVIPMGAALPINETRMGRVIEERNLWYTPDITLETYQDSIMLVKSGIRSVMNCPLISGGNFIGTLNVADSKLNAYSEQDQDLLFQVSAHLASTLEGRSNDEIVKKQVKELASLANKLSKYLSPQIYESIFTGKQEVKLESNRKKLTIFFSDIQGFTAVTDSMESEELTQLLNEYLTEMSSIALQFGGTIDKYIGDAIMIFFGDPKTKGDKQNALACVLMALKMQERMKYLQEKWYNQGISNPLKIRMGINTGYCTVGNFGSATRLDYTIIGGQVNLASRLESHAAPDQILISHQTFSLVQDKIVCEKREEMKVKGIAYPVQTYEVAGLVNE